jgi:hypothetical protein
MKLIKSLTLAIALGLTFTGCDKKPEGGGTGGGGGGGTAAAPVVDEKAAFAAYSKEMEAISKWGEERQKAVQAAAAKDPQAAGAEGAAFMTEMVAKFKAVKTDGLPADYKSAWSEFLAGMDEMAAVTKSMTPAKDAKPEDIIKAATEGAAKMQAIGAKMEPLQKKMTEIGKKYGVDMDKVMKN